ncbi:MAG: rod shape-determining protein MreC [Holosporales bacterium]|jgi:cell shape-determining protein MreC|nr:rod shape-determining protein MreC [Holosporales bacterium]
MPSPVQKPKSIPHTAVTLRRRQAFLSLLLGCVGIGGLHTPYMAPYIEQARFVTMEAKAVLLKKYHIHIVEKLWELLGLSDQHRTIETLQEQLITSRIEEQRAQYLRQENAELRNLLAIDAPQEFIALGARILGQTEAHTHTLMLDIGTDKGVCLNAAVVVRDGLIGRITQVGKDWSQVLLVTDGTARIPVSLYPSGERAILSGDFSQTLRVDLLRNLHFNSEQLALTSEVGACFPKGVPVGSMDVKTSALRVIPAASAQNLEFVCVLISVAATQERTYAEP